MIVGLCIFLAGPWASSFGRLLAHYTIGAGLVFLGLGLVGKRKFGLRLLYVFATLGTIGALLSARPIDLFLAAGWWVVPCASYYPKRRGEFQ